MYPVDFKEEDMIITEGESGDMLYALEGKSGDPEVHGGVRRQDGEDGERGGSVRT